MNELLFSWTEATSLTAELSRAIKRFSISFAAHGRPLYVVLWRSDGTGLKIYSEMHDVAEMREVGVLHFGLVLAPLSEETFVDIPPAFDDQLAVTKLTIEESGTVAESGIILTANDGEEMIIVAGANPYLLAVQGVPSTPHLFEPEYPLDQYVRVPAA